MAEMENQPVMKKLDQVLERLKLSRENTFFSGATAQDVAKIEQELGIPLPASYKNFLRRSNGAILYQSDEILGVGSDEQEKKMDDILKLKNELDLDKNLIPFAERLNEAYFCFDNTRELPNEELTIVEVKYSGEKKESDKNSFVDWLEDLATKKSQI